MEVVLPHPYTGLDLPLPDGFVNHEIGPDELVFHLTQLGYYPKGESDDPNDCVYPPQSFTAWAVQNRCRPLLIAAVVDEICTGAKIGAWVGLEANV